MQVNNHCRWYKFDIRDPERLEQAERLLSRFAARGPLIPPPDMTPEGLQRIHRHLFGAIFPWAGEFRTVNLEKLVTAEKTVAFELGALVKPNVQRFFAELRDDGYLRDLDTKTFAYRAAVYLEDMNFIHPFREGNGRTARLFAEHLARQAGHELDQSRIDPRGWMEGSIQSHRQPIDGAHDIMSDVIAQALTGPAGKDSAFTRAIRKARAAEQERDPDERER